MQQNNVMHEQMTRLYQAANQLKGVTGQSAVARLLGETPQTVKNWESRGISNAGLLSAQRVIGCRAEWLESEHGEMLPKSYTITAEAGHFEIAKQIDPPTKTAGEATATGMEIALLYDLIPVTDRVRRTRAYNAATTAILAVLEEQPATPRGDPDSRK